MKYFKVTVKIDRSQFVNAEDEQEARKRALALLGIDDKTPGDVRVYVEEQGVLI